MKIRNRFGIKVLFKNGKELVCWIGKKQSSYDYLRGLQDEMQNATNVFYIRLTGIGKVIFDPKEVLIATLIWEPIKHENI